MIKSINLRLLSSAIINKRPFDLGVELKSLNDKKQFRKTLELFNKYKEKDIQTLSSLTITQVLKACTHLGDLHRGSTVHQRLQQRVKEDVYIQVSLIHLYSK